jgi:hypothetical protein
MSLSTHLSLVGVAAVLSACAAACVVEQDPQGYSSGGGSTATPPPSGTGSDPGTNGNSITPVLVDVDTGRTMSAQPGDGLGVFVEYHAGGHWHIWWTCDTNKTNQSCPMDVKITFPARAPGAFTNAQADGVSASGVSPLVASPTQLESVTTTTTGIDGMTFDTAAGAVVSLEASIGSLKDGSFIFFVQNGKINGGFTGKLTDPLELEGSAP